MPHNKSTKKRVKTSEVRRQRNMARRSRMRHALRDARNLVSTAESALDEGQAKQVTEVQSLLDRMASKGLIHANKAARIKGRLQRQANNAG